MSGKARRQTWAKTHALDLVIWCGLLLISDCEITWELVRNAESQASGIMMCILTRFSGDLHAHWSLRNFALNQHILLKKKWWMSDCFLCNDKKQICQMKTGLYWKELQCPFYKPNLFLKWMIFLQIPYWFCCPRRLLKPFHDKCLRSIFVLLAAW